DQSIGAPPFDNLLSYNLLTDLTDTAVFGNVTWYITPRLDVTGGIRAGWIRQTFQQLAGGNDLAAENTLSQAFGLLPTPA
ncbi:hypothetical protein, partial [Anoxybacillus sp. LAT27]|uniref:hypothetical protein n=1 Tax=Anoxybacillus sp. LAT27 TaxID=2878409 RepID=UPI001EDC5892